MESQKNDGRSFLSVCTKIYDPRSKDSGVLKMFIFEGGMAWENGHFSTNTLCMTLKLCRDVVNMLSHNWEKFRVDHVIGVYFTDQNSRIFRKNAIFFTKLSNIFNFFYVKFSIWESNWVLLCCWQPWAILQMLNKQTQGSRTIIFKDVHFTDQNSDFQEFYWKIQYIVL